jgi:hypothetical protein
VRLQRGRERGLRRAARNQHANRQAVCVVAYRLNDDRAAEGRCHADRPSTLIRQGPSVASRETESLGVRERRPERSSSGSEAHAIVVIGGFGHVSPAMTIWRNFDPS